MIDPSDKFPVTLTDDQRSILEGFVGHYRGASEVREDVQQHYDTLAALLKLEFITEHGLVLEHERDYFVAMTGLSQGAAIIERVIDDGHTPHNAAVIALSSIRRLSPEYDSSKDFVTTRADLVGFFDLASAYIRDNIKKSGIDIKDPADYEKLQSGFTVAVETIQRMVTLGMSTLEAGENLRTAFAYLAPLT